MSEQLSFLEPVPLNPRMPSPHTLPARALAHLLTGQALTQRQFLADSWRLAAAVHELARMGWPVLTDRLPAPSNIAPGGNVAAYRLAPRHLPELRALAAGRG